MIKSFYISILLMFSFSVLFAQKNINAYKYILIPKQFEFQKSTDQYQLNSLTKFLFEKAGFNAIFTDETYPEDLANNSCLALKAIVNSKSSLLSTKVSIDLLDCHNTIIFSTIEGRSKEKDYTKAYQEAIRNSFAELEELDYTYDGSVATIEKVSAEKKVEDIIPSVEKIEVLVPKPVKELTPAIEVPEVAMEKEVNKSNKPTIVLDKKAMKSIEGKFEIADWGKCVISAKDNGYSVIGGDEHFEFATIYKTSKPMLYIIKWAAYKQPQLLEVDNQENLRVDSENGVVVYKRIN